VSGGPPRPPTESARLDPARHAPFTPHAGSGCCGAGGAERLALPQATALAFAAVGKRVFVVYASFGSGAEPQVLGVASSAPRAAELAERSAGEDRYGWRRPDWLEWDSARRVRPAVDGRGNAVEVWLVQVGLDELIRLVLEPEPLLEEHD
jgi:hypothetical protein